MRAKCCNFAKSVAVFKKHEPAQFSMSVTSGLNVRRRCRLQKRQW